MLFNILRSNGDKASAPNEPGRPEQVRLHGLARMRELLRSAGGLQVVVPTVRTRLLGGFVPTFDVLAGPSGYTVISDVPGFEENDLEIQVTGHRLTVSGRRPTPASSADDEFIVHERGAGMFNRTFEFPEEIDADRLEAELKGGVLTVLVPRHGEASPKRVPLRHTAAPPSAKA